MLDLEGTLTYDCPESRREVLTGILTDEATLTRLGALKLSVWCPHCAAPHMIAAQDASISSVNTPVEVLARSYGRKLVTA
jgi:hypothetical protein